MYSINVTDFVLKKKRTNLNNGRNEIKHIRNILSVIISICLVVPVCNRVTLEGNLFSWLKSTKSSSSMGIVSPWSNSFFHQSYPAAILSYVYSFRQLYIWSSGIWAGVWCAREKMTRCPHFLYAADPWADALFICHGQHPLLKVVYIFHPFPFSLWWH